MVRVQGKERVWVVARCALIACLASVVVGMNGGFNSPALVELENSNLTTPAQHFNKKSQLPNLFGVSLVNRLTLHSTVLVLLAACLG